MLRSKPRLSYCGLTIVLSNPSRFDIHSLLSSTGGSLFNDYCLRPEFNSMQCDIRLADDNSPLLDGTRCLLLMGEKSLHQWAPQTVTNTIHEMRGSCLLVQGIPAIPTYLPQDAADSFKNYEKEHNPEAQDYGDDEGGDDDDEGDVKSLGKTKRANYPFWLKSDTEKAKRILDGFNPFSRRKQPTYILAPSSTEVIEALSSTKGGEFYFDIETDYEDQNLLCFAFSFGGDTVWSVPIIGPDYKWHYSNNHLILRALSHCLRDNVCVAHNGHTFDYLVLAFKYHIPVVRCYDTMMAMHRCYPGVEKSLAHCVSKWTWEPFHKDMDSKSYRTHTDMMQKLAYCGRDVFTMFLVKQAIDDFAKSIPGLEASIKSANDSIVPYLTTTMQGMEYDSGKVGKIIEDNDKLMMQYIRCCELLIGKNGMEEVRSVIKGKKPGAFPGSNAQCCQYFHEMLGYPVMFRSTDTGKPSLGKKSLYKLALRFPDNPVITFCNLYRQVKKETGALSFNAWRDGNNKIMPRWKELV